MKSTLLVFLLNLVTQLCFGQIDSAHNKFTEIKDIVLREDEIFGIGKDGGLTIWSSITGERYPVSYDTMNKFVSIAISKESSIMLGTNRGQIFSISPSQKEPKLERSLKKEVAINGIVINSSNKLFLVVPNAIYDPINDRCWYHFVHYNHQVIVKRKFLLFFKKRTNNYFQMPETVFIDNDDIIWMTSNYGEFGGSIQRFDTRTRKEINKHVDSLRYTMLFPQNIFSDRQNNIYISSGVQHFSNFGEIKKIKNHKAETIFESEDFKDKYPDELFVGPCTIDSLDNYIYISTSEGVFKAKLPKEGKINEIKFLFKPEIYWGREPLAIGAEMSIKKLMIAHDDKIIFLTAENGIGIYDCKQVKFLK